MQTRRLATSFEGLNSSVANLPGELWSCRLAQYAQIGKSTWQQRC